MLVRYTHKAGECRTTKTRKKPVLQRLESLRKRRHTVPFVSLLAVKPAAVVSLMCAVGNDSSLYWVPQKLPQIYTVIAYICIEKVA